jgi:hypothetical protein
MGGLSIGTVLLSPDQKQVYMNFMESMVKGGVWKWNVNSLSTEKLVDQQCGGVSDVDPSGKCVLTTNYAGEKRGIYEVSISERKCVPLLPGVTTYSATFAPDGKSFLYAVASRREVTIYRQPWSDGTVIGSFQVGLKVPFTFPISYRNGNAYDFFRDLFHHRLRATRRCRPVSLEPEIDRGCGQF